MAKTTTPAPKAMQADSMMDDLTPAPDATAKDAATDVATDAPDLSGPATTPDAAGADNAGQTPEEQHDAIISSATKASPTPEQQQMMAEAQAKADAAAAELSAQAEVQAKLDAQAEANAWDELEKAEAVDVERLQLLIGQIDRLNHTGHRLGLMDELHDVYGMTGIFKKGVGFSLSMAGIDIDPAPDHETALTNWANAARRAIMAAAA